MERLPEMKRQCAASSQIRATHLASAGAALTAQRSHFKRSSGPGRKEWGKGGMVRKSVMSHRGGAERRKVDGNID